MRPDYATNDPKGWCGDPTRGAALGRPSDHEPGGYDALGTYSGLGAPLYWAASDCGAVDYMLRAPDRAAARVLVLAEYPQAKVRP